MSENKERGNTMKKDIHAAYSPVTGEIITATRVNVLNRAIKEINRWERIHHGEIRNRWYFGHGKNCIKKAMDKAH